MAREQLARIRDRLRRQPQDRDEAVHEARKRFKKLRALLKLVRDEIPKKSSRKENTCFRDAARPLSEVRDARVLVEALDELGDTFPEVSADEKSQVHAVLLRRQEEVDRRVLDEQDVLGDITDVARLARKRVKNWAPRTGDWSILQAGLRRTYRKGRQALAVVHAALTDENLHEWRKRVKDLRYQLEILQPIRPDILEELANKAHQLTDCLGNDHDLVVLSETMSQVFPTEKNGSHAAEWSRLIERRRGEFLKDALRLGEQLFQRQPRQFVRHLKAHWKEWRQTTKAEQFA